MIDRCRCLINYYPSSSFLSLDLFKHATNKHSLYTLADFPDEDLPETTTPEEILRIAEKWVKRCRSSAIVAMTAWIAWIISAQVLREFLPASMYMLNSDDAAMTGW